jgi:hypothetical protein
MHILLTILTICLVYVAVAVLASIIIFQVIGFGGRSNPFVDSVTEMPTAKKLTLSRNGEICQIDCQCHSQGDFPGMRCMDCYGEDCDEGTKQ